MKKETSLEKIRRKIQGLFSKQKDVKEAYHNNYAIPNEAVNLEKEIIFIAIPKNGTTNIRHQLHQPGKALIPNPHLNIMQIKDLLYVWLLSTRVNLNYAYPTKDIPADGELRTKANQMFNRFFKFASVRNPWARTVSLYSRREGVPTRDKMSFEAFCENHRYASDTCHQPTLHKNQLDWLCDKNGACLMDYVCKLENMQAAVKEIEKRTNGRLKLSPGKANVNPDSDSAHYRKMYTPRARDIIARRFKKDIDYFGYSF